MDGMLMPLNFVSNLILSFAFVLFMIFLFGRENSKIYTLPWYKTIAIKIGLALCSAGSLLNVFTFSNPPWTEILLNVGLAFTFVWASWFHYRTFVIPYKSGTCVSSTASKKKAKRIKRSVNKV